MHIGAIIVVAVVLVIIAVRALTTHFVCEKCGERFRVNVLSYIFAPHMMGKRMAKCPKCGYTGMMMPTWSKK